MSKEAWFNVMDDLNKRGSYLKIPKKDNGVERIYPYHPELKNTKLTDVIKEVQYKKFFDGIKITQKDIKNYIKKDKKIWLETMGYDYSKSKNSKALDALYKKAFISNYLYEKGWNFDSAVARIKRESLLAMKSFYEADPKFFKGSEVDVKPDVKNEFYHVSTTGAMEKRTSCASWTFQRVLKQPNSH